MSEIHWPTELRKIEREFDGLPPELSPAEERMRRELERVEQQREHEKIAAFGGSVRLMLVGALGAALYVWPYPRECGAGLYAYMFASSVMVLGGLWVAAYTWRGRVATLHVLALTVALAGLVVLSSQALPRVGYAKVDPANPPRWACGAPPSNPPAASPVVESPTGELPTSLEGLPTQAPTVESSASEGAPPAS